MKVTLNGIGSLIEATTAASTINANNQTIENAFNNTLSLDGTAPNQMGSEFDMNSHQVLNLPVPATANSPLRLQDLSTFIGGGIVTNIPSGGSTGDALVKNSNTNYDLKWTSDSNTVAAGNNIVITGTSPATIATTTTPTFTTVNTATVPTTVDTLVARNTTDTLTNKTLVAPALGTPASGVATNLTGTASGLTAGHVTTNANLTGVITSVGNATSIAAQTGTGTTFVVDTSPVLVTPNLGTPSAGVLTNATGTAAGLTAGNVTTNANLTGAVTSVGNAASLGSFTSLALKTALTDETGSGAAVFGTSPALTTPTGIVKGDVGLGNVDNTSDATKWAATATLTNKTYDTAGTGNSFSINGVAATANTGTGSVVRATSPTLVTPVLGTPSSGTLTSCTGYTVANLSDGAWTTYTPTVTASAGTPTTVTATGRWKQIGKTVIAEMDITITTIGTATQVLNATLPTNAAAFRYVGSFFEYSLTGKSGAGYINGGSQPTFIQSRPADATSWWSNGNTLACTVVYEIP